ncbi:hypothetical protein Nmel_013908 [Mimus melanotis]
MPGIVSWRLSSITAFSCQAQHIHPAGSWWPLATRSQEPCWAAGLAQLCTSPAQACSAWLCLLPWAGPGHARELCHNPEPCYFSTGHQTLPRGPAWECQGSHVDQQLWWPMCQQPAAPALFQRTRVSTWARGTVPTSTAAATTEPLCQKGMAAAGRAAGACWTPMFFYLLCFNCLSLSAAQPTDCSGT